jgi:hypothetical protein
MVQKGNMSDNKRDENRQGHKHVPPQGECQAIKHEKLH